MSLDAKLTKHKRAINDVLKKAINLIKKKSD